LELVPGEFLDELLAGADDLRAGVVVLVGWNAGALDALGNGVLDLEGEISCCPLSSWSPWAWMCTTRASGKATALLGLTAVPDTRSPLSSRLSRSSGTGRPSKRISFTRVTVALLRRFLRLKRTPSSTFSRLPSVYICLRMRDGIFMSRTSSRKVGTVSSIPRRGGGLKGGLPRSAVDRQQVVT
jgi:hypothetical protein